MSGSHIWKSYVQMNKFGPKNNISDKGFMIQNNFPTKYDVILDGLESYFTPNGYDALIIKVIWEN